MAEKEYWIGTRGPFIYDDEYVLDEEGSTGSQFSGSKPRSINSDGPGRVGLPEEDRDIASYGDALHLIRTSDLKKSVRAATDGTNVDLASSTDPNPIDGVTLSDGDRVLLKDQTAASENGIYEAVTATDPSTWVRASDADTDAKVTSALIVFVEEGTINDNKGFILETADPITVDSTGLVFSDFTGGSSGYPSISDDETEVVSEASDVNFSSGLVAADDGDGTVTVTSKRWQRWFGV